MTGSSLVRLLTLINLRYTGRNQIQAAMPLMPAQTNRTSSSAVRILPAVSPVFFIFSPFSFFSCRAPEMPQQPQRVSKHKAELPKHLRFWGLCPIRMTDLTFSP